MTLQAEMPRRVQRLWTTAAAWLEVSVGVRVCSWGPVGSNESLMAALVVLGRRIERHRLRRVAVLGHRNRGENVVGGTEGAPLSPGLFDSAAPDPVAFELSGRRLLRWKGDRSGAH